ncbi:hypothetical protein CXB39_01715 [Pseudomonas amygdali pv. morsprunorum]|nr:hypothetical protein CXB39_01715 [Pseudomonas amygdali pv. morsprunorum]
MGMQFVTLRVTQRFCDVRWLGVRLRSPLLSQTPLVPHAPRGNAVVTLASHSGSAMSGGSGFDSGHLCYPRRLSFLTLRVGMQFLTLRVTQRFCDVRWIGVRLRSPLLSQTPLVPHAPCGNAVRDAPRHTAVL